VAISLDGNTAYVLSNGLFVINTHTNTITAQLGVGGESEAVAPDGSALYVVDSFAGRVVVIDLATLTVRTQIPVGAMPDSIAITPDGKNAFVANAADGTVTPLDLATATARTPISVGASNRPLIFDP